MGSYFGSSLCAVDLNQDGLSDLLVGAPMHSQLRDEGQVSVYLSKGNVSGTCGSAGTQFQTLVDLFGYARAPDSASFDPVQSVFRTVVFVCERPSVFPSLSFAVV